MFLIQHLWAATLIFSNVEIISKKNFFFSFSLIFFSLFLLFPCGLEMSLRDIALISPGLKHLRLKLLIT